MWRKMGYGVVWPVRSRAFPFQGRSLTVSVACCVLFQEVEKLAAKRGVTIQSVKEVLQGLCDDDLVCMEKVGIQNVFWSFPSATSVKLEAETAKLKTALEALAKEEEEAKGRLEEERLVKGDCPERGALEARLGEVQGRVHAKKRELEKFSATDPERFETLKRLKVSTRDGANRWVDNLFVIEKWLRTQFNMEKKSIQEFFAHQGVPRELEYVE